MLSSSPSTMAMVGQDTSWWQPESYFGENNRPKHYIQTDVNYTKIKLDLFFKPRGILSKELISLTKHLPAEAVIAGSYVASVVCPIRKSSDIDIFFTSPKAFKSTFELFLSPPDTDDAWMFKGYKSDTSMEDLISRSKDIRVITLRHEDATRHPIQLIKMVWYDSPEHVIDSFDFTVTQFAVCDNTFICNPVSLVDIFNNALIIHRHQFPMEALYRLVKYAKKGYNISPKTIAKFVEDIREATELGPPMPFTIY